VRARSRIGDPGGVTNDDATLIIEALLDIRTELRRIRGCSRRRPRASKETKRKIREEVAADQERYDDLTRRLKERVERGRPADTQADKRREST
jgi:hypothetical protein